MNSLLDSLADLTEDLSIALAALLRTSVNVSLAGMDRSSFGEFRGSLESPTYVSVLKCNPPCDCMLLSVEPTILYPMIDRLLGGRDDGEPPACRPLTDIELPLAARIVGVFLDQLVSLWSDVAELNVNIASAESNARLLRSLPADEPVVIARYRATLGHRQGAIRLCMPCRLIERLGEEPLAENAATLGEAASADAAAAPPVDVQVTLARTSITAEQLRSLRPGDIIATETDAASPAVVSLAGQPKFLARPGIWRGRMAVTLAGSPALPKAESSSG